MLFFFIPNSFLIASYNLPSKLISPAAHVVLSHIFNPAVQCKPCAIVQQLSAHSPQTFPMAMLARKVILAGLVTPPVPGPPARLSMGPGRVSGMVPMPAVPQHTFHWGWRGCQGLQQVWFKGNESKNPLAFCHHDKAGQSEERSHCSTHCPRPQSGGRTSHLRVQRQRHLQVHGQSPAGAHGTPAIASLSHQFQLQ